MADFNIKEIQGLKLKIQVLEQITIAVIVLIVIAFYNQWNAGGGFLLTSLVVIQVFKWRFKKQLKQKEFLAKVVEERTIELRVQRDQVMKESRELSDALDALARAQGEIVRNERLATVGNLTKGLLDRILNPINYINNFADLSVDLLEQLEQDIRDDKGKLSAENYEDTMELIEMVKGNLRKITDHGSNTVRIVKAMEEVLKDMRGNMVPADINNLCKVNLDVIAKQHEKEVNELNIKLKLSRLSLSLMIEMNIEQMSKVIQQLLKNSMYAIVRKAAKETFDPEISIILEKRSNSILIKVRDNGIGIEESIKDKIFEPFFTTKPTSEASGIGLYLCREIILNHRGVIQVQSEKDMYTEVTLDLPIHQNTEDNG